MHTVIAPQPASRERAVRWHTLSPDEVAHRLATDALGLPDAEVGRRREAYGPNEVPTAPETPLWSVLLHQFLDPLIYILLIAAAVSLLLRDPTDAAVILAVVVINAIIGFTQEARARREMRALARLSAPRAEVVRGGVAGEIASRDLVPGDVVVLASGARVPADLRLFQLRDLEVDESALTGESLPVRKRTDTLASESLVPGDQLNMVFSGTVVTRGRARGFVVRTGAATELGSIASAVQALGQTGTPLQEKMARFGRLVGVGILLLCVLVGGVGLVRGMAAGEIFLVAVALAVSAIPEGLPVVLTITLAVGVHRMAQRRAIIRTLPAVETLGSTTVVGSDKTGTLTRNQMTVRPLGCGAPLLAARHRLRCRGPFRITGRAGATGGGSAGGHPRADAHRRPPGYGADGGPPARPRRGEQRRRGIHARQANGRRFRQRATGSRRLCPGGARAQAAHRAAAQGAGRDRRRHRRRGQ
jgi:magnesium-transporting ATPase (P-type)